MKFEGDTRDWLLKAALWISAEESFEEAYDALRRAKNQIRASEDKAMAAGRLDRSDIYRLIEAVVWTSRAVNLNDIASNLVDLFTALEPGDFELNGHASYFEGSFYECRVPPENELSDFWNLRVESAKGRGASSSLHNLFDFVLRTVEIGVHPLKPDPVGFIVEDLTGESSVDDPGIKFIVETHHRSARITVDSDQFVSIHDKVIWIDDSSGRMGVVGGEPLPVLGQPEGDEPALRVANEGEEMLQPFHSIHLTDEEDESDE